VRTRTATMAVVRVSALVMTVASAGVMVTAMSVIHL
jgi:hypothetical protein